jgi:hypothetical protein
VPGSREVDVVGETFGPGSVEESQEGSSLGGPRSPSDHDDDAVVRSLSRELKEVISIARDDDQVVTDGMVEDRGVRGLTRERLAHATHLMTEVLE